jgi:A118 family predicted phage portal protein
MILEKIWQWIRRLFMNNKTTIKEALGITVAISDPMVEALKLWTLMYENKPPWANEIIKPLQLPAAIASEISRSVTLEMKAEFGDSSRDKYLEEQFIKIMEGIREIVEFGCAKGGVILKPYVRNKSILVDVVHADQFFPVSFDSEGNIQSCVFVDQRKIGDHYYTRFEHHDLTNGKYKVTNKAYKSKEKENLGNEAPLTEVDVWSKLQPTASITKIDKPLFAYFKYPLANNIDSSSPLGVSSFSRAVEMIKQADTQWSDLLWEFESGKRALYVDVLAFGKTADGKPILPNKRLYKTLESGSMEGELFEAWTPDLREQNILNGLDAILKRIEFTCGLAYGTLSDPNTVDKTATEIKTSKQRTYSTVTDTQKALTKALDQLVWAMDTWATLKKLAPKGKYKVVYDYDDSVIVDKEVQLVQDLRLLNASVMGRVEFRMRNLNEDEATAKKKIAEIDEEKADQMEHEASIVGDKTPLIKKDKEKKEVKDR